MIRMVPIQCREFYVCIRRWNCSNLSRAPAQLLSTAIAQAHAISKRLTRYSLRKLASSVRRHSLFLPCSTLRRNTPQFNARRVPCSRCVVGGLRARVMCDWIANVGHPISSPDMLTTAKRLRESLPSYAELWTRLNLELLERTGGSNAPAWRLSQILRLSSDLPHCKPPPPTAVACASTSTTPKRSRSLVPRGRHRDSPSHNKNGEHGSFAPSGSFSRIAAVNRAQWHCGTFSRDVESGEGCLLEHRIGQARFGASSRSFCELPPKGGVDGSRTKSDPDGGGAKETDAGMLTVVDENVGDPTAGVPPPESGMETTLADASSGSETDGDSLGSEPDSEGESEATEPTSDETGAMQSSSVGGESGEAVSDMLDSGQLDRIGSISESLADAMKGGQNVDESILEKFSTESASVGVHSGDESLDEDEEEGDGAAAAAVEEEEEEGIVTESKILEKSLNVLAMGHTSSEESDSDDDTDEIAGKPPKRSRSRRKRWRLTGEDYKKVKSNTLGPEKMNILPPELLRVDTRESLLRAQAMAEQAINRVKSGANDVGGSTAGADGKGVNGDERLGAANGEVEADGNVSDGNTTEESDSGASSSSPDPVVNGVPPVIEDRKHEPLILMMIGCQGSGKTKFSLDLVQYGAVPWARINQDTLRGKHYKGLRIECVQKARQLLALGYCVIIDRMNFDHGQRAEFIELTKELGLTIHGVVFKLPYIDNVYNVANRTDHEGQFQGNTRAHRAIIHRTRNQLFYRNGLPRQVDDDFSTVVRCESNEHYAAAFRQWVNYGRPMSGGKTLTMDMWKQMMSDKRSLMLERKPRFRHRGPPTPMTPEMQESVIGYVPGRDGPILQDTSEEEAETTEGE